MSAAALTELRALSGVTEDGRGFVTVTAVTTAGMALGQLSPAEVRSLAFDLLEAAEAAVSDAAIYRSCLASDLDNPGEVAATIIAAVRRHREEDQDEDADG